MGFTSAQGYDMATGLGSVNAANLSSQWSSVHFNSSSTTLGLSSTNFNFGTNVTLTGTVAGSGTPTGDVAFIVTQGVIGDTYNTETGALNGSVAFATLSGGSYSAVLNNLPGGTYYVTARYAGDENFASSLSTPVQVTVGQDSGTTLTVVPRYLPQGDVPCYNDFFSPTLPPIPASLSVEYPAQIWFDVQVAGASGAGAPTGTVQLFDAGNPIATLTLDPTATPTVWRESRRITTTTTAWSIRLSWRTSRSLTRERTPSRRRIRATTRSRPRARRCLLLQLTSLRTPIRPL